MLVFSSAWFLVLAVHCHTCQESSSCSEIPDIAELLDQHVYCWNLSLGIIHDFASFVLCDIV